MNIWLRDDTDMQVFNAVSANVAASLSESGLTLSPNTLLSVTVDMTNMVTAHKANAKADLWTDGLLIRLLNGSPDLQEVILTRGKIHGIKDLRTLTGCGLKAAKDAVEAWLYAQPE